MVKYKGYELELGGTKYVFPPLSLGAIEMLQEKITEVTVNAASGNMLTQIGSIIDISLASLKRNYPEITREQVADMIDISNIESIFVNIMSTSGMVSTSSSTDGGEAKN